jgi:hypothetical protein
VKFNPANDLPADNHFLDSETSTRLEPQLMTLGRQMAKSSRPKAASKAPDGADQASADPRAGC